MLQRMQIRTPEDSDVDGVTELWSICALVPPWSSADGRP